MVNDNDRTPQDQEEIVTDTTEPNFDDPDLEVAEARSNDKLKALREKLKHCEEEKRGYLEELQRTKADFLNSKRRLEEQKDRDVERVTDSFIESLAPLYESFQTAMSNQAVWESVDQTWRTGIESIFTQLKKTMLAHGADVVTPELGSTFNPAEHEAVGMTEATAGQTPDTIAEVIQPGIVRNGEIIRAAKVILYS